MKYIIHNVDFFFFFWYDPELADGTLKPYIIYSFFDKYFIYLFNNRNHQHI
jgi:hypothetical protein